VCGLTPLHAPLKLVAIVEDAQGLRAGTLDIVADSAAFSVVLELVINWIIHSKTNIHSKTRIVLAITCHVFVADRNGLLYGVATISRLLRIIGLFCKRAL